MEPRTTWVYLRGPSSPLEMKIYPMSRSLLRAIPNIEWNSINSILLDSEPQNPSDRLLVAGFVGTNEGGDHLSLRDTTLMPNIHGMVGLMCLLFTPFAELRVNKQRTKITGALCGLGYNPVTNESYNPVNDVEVHFDAELTLTDIEIINKIRFWLNKYFCNAGGEHFLEAISGQSKVKEYLITLLTRRRKFQSLETPTKVFKWNALPREHVMVPGDTYSGEADVFKLHAGVHLEKTEPEEAIKEIRKSLIELWKIATVTHESTITRDSSGACKLCNNLMLKNRIAVKLHLSLRDHRYNEFKMFGMNLEKFPEVAFVEPSLPQGRSGSESYGYAEERFERRLWKGKTGKRENRAHLLY